MDWPEDTAQAMAICDAMLLELTADATESDRIEVATQLWECLSTFTRKGQIEAAIGLVSKIEVAFAGDRSHRLVGRAAAALSVRAELEANAGDLDAANTSVGAALKLVASSEELRLRGPAVGLLLLKARLLHQEGRFAEGVVTLDEAFQSISAASKGTDEARARFAATAAVMKLDALTDSGEWVRCQEVPDQLSRVLSAIGASTTPESHESTSGEERDLAAALASLLDDEQFDAAVAGTLDIAEDAAVSRAVDLYQIAARALPDGQSAEMRAASIILRRAGDVYGALAQKIPNMPVGLIWSRSSVSSLVADTGLEAWAATHGIHLAIPTATDESDRADGLHTFSVESPTAIHNIVKALYLYEVVVRLGRSGRGLSAFTQRRLRNVAADHFAFGVQAILQSPADPSVHGIAFACWIIAQRLFAVSRAPDRGWLALEDESAAVRETLRSSDVSTWLQQHGASGPKTYD